MWQGVGDGARLGRDASRMPIQALNLTGTADTVHQPFLTGVYTTRSPAHD